MKNEILLAAVALTGAFAECASAHEPELREVSRRVIRENAEPMNFCFGHLFPDGSIYMGHSIGRHMVTERAASIFSPDKGKTWTFEGKGSGFCSFVTKDGRKRFVNAWDHAIAKEHSVSVTTRVNNEKGTTVKTKIVMPEPMLCLFHRDVLRLDDGTLLLTGYSVDESSGKSRARAYVVASDDDGLNWRFLSFLPQVEDAEEGVNEAAIVQLKDGRVKAFVRTGDDRQGNTRVIALMGYVSHDRGKTWGEGKAVADYGVDPQTGLLSDGTLFLLSGRPGVYLMLDPTGTGDHFRRHDVFKGRGSAYSTLMEVEPGKLLIVYDESAFVNQKGDKPVNRIMQVEYEYR